MTIAWIVGQRGLLGSALRRALLRDGVHLFEQTERFCWYDESNLFVQFEVAVKAFANYLGTENQWQIYWAAGVGTMTSSVDQLVVESRALSKLLGLIESEGRLSTVPGSFVFASSAGAIYAGTASHTVNESTAVAPTTAYAREKLWQEGIVSRLAYSGRKATVLLARISTLYGSGQSGRKKQGLVSCIARNIVQNRPTHIYVPLDTVRDYIAVDDAAANIVAAVLATRGVPGVYLKIIADERPTTISEIVSIFKRVSRRAPRLITSANSQSPIYAHRVQFSSINIPVKSLIPRTSLPVGIAQVFAAERVEFVVSTAHRKRGR